MNLSWHSLSNYRAALDAATALCIYIERQRRGASERGRWTSDSKRYEHADN
jgi:hypothetical protein